MESIVTSLKWSKKLKEAGWPQTNSTFFRWCWDDKLFVSSFLESNGAKLTFAELGTPFAVEAPTAEEILRTLPNIVRASLDGNAWCVIYGKNLQEGRGFFSEHSLANAAAAAYCYLAENKLLPPL